MRLAVVLVIVAVLSSASAWKYYLINHTPMTWAHAQRVCRATNDSELLTVRHAARVRLAGEVLEAVFRKLVLDRSVRRPNG